MICACIATGEFRNEVSSIDDAHIPLLPTFDHNVCELSDCTCEEELLADHGCESDSDSRLSGYILAYPACIAICYS